MFTQSMTKHVVSRVNEEDGVGGAVGNSSSSRFLNSCIIHMSRVIAGYWASPFLPPPPPAQDGLVSDQIFGSESQI